MENEVEMGASDSELMSIVEFPFWRAVDDDDLTILVPSVDTSGHEALESVDCVVQNLLNRNKNYCPACRSCE